MDKIMTIGLSEEQMNFLRNCGLHCEWMFFDYYTDIIAHYADLTIINPNVLKADERDCIVEFFREIDPTNEPVILTSEDEAFKGISFVEVIPDFFDYPDSIQYILMKKLRQEKRDVDFSRKIMLAFRILILIKNNPGISSQKIAEETEISARSVKRYIRSLQAADIMIEYKDRGWSCEAPYPNN